MTPSEYLDSAKSALEIESDYALAHRFDVLKQEISQVRKGKKPLNAYLAARVADATGRDVDSIIADIEAQTDKNEKRAAYWRNRLARKERISIL